MSALRSSTGTGRAVHVTERAGLAGDGSGAGALPRTGVLVVATWSTVEYACAVLGMGGRPTVLAGAIVLEDEPTENGREPDAPEQVELPVPVLGSVSELPTLAARLGLKVGVVCLPAGHGQSRLIRTRLEQAGLSWRELPSVDELTTPGPRSSPGSGGGHTLERMGGAIDLGKLIGRTPHDLDRAAVARILSGKRVLVTGAGGSIGSELCRVVAGFNPERLILMERSENALFEIDRQMGASFPAMARKAVLHDVVDAEATMRLCMAYQPHVVIHAAAHKHVPLMEDHPAHAVTNNVFGTKAIADAAVACGAERFVLISSDKAVNPTSVMGATKRLAEMYVHGIGARTSAASHGGGTAFSLVRFGNVLGSAASVLTIWGRQIAEGGPLTITDPRMTRYFMTIPEAATLVIQSMTLGGQGEQGEGRGVGVFVLDMGEPIRIVELAERFVKAHGLTPRVVNAGTSVEQAGVGAGEIPIVITGARPGEKLHEELAYAAEALRPTAHPGVRVWIGPGFEAQADEHTRAGGEVHGLDRMIADLHAARHCPDRARVLATIRAWVPEMRPGATGIAGPVSDAEGESVHPLVG